MVASRHAADLQRTSRLKLPRLRRSAATGQGGWRVCRAQSTAGLLIGMRREGGGSGFVWEQAADLHAAALRLTANRCNQLSQTQLCTPWPAHLLAPPPPPRPQSCRCCPSCSRSPAAAAVVLPGCVMTAVRHAAMPVAVCSICRRPEGRPLSWAVEHKGCRCCQAGLGQAGVVATVCDEEVAQLVQSDKGP